MFDKIWIRAAIVSTIVLTAAGSLWSQQREATPAVVLANGKVKLTAPKGWRFVRPKSSVIQYEFAIPAEKGDSMDGRLTVSSAGGSVKANIDRWIGQFEQPDGKPTRERAKVDKREISGQDVHVVNVEGIFHDRPRGPFGPVETRPGFRMLGAIIQTKDTGLHFIKLYGPKKTIDATEEQFDEFLKSLQTE